MHDRDSQNSECRPAPVNLPHSTLLLGVGLQSGVLPVIHQGEEIVAKSLHLLKAARLTGRAVVFSELDPDDLGETLTSLWPYDRARVQTSFFDATRADGFFSLVPEAISDVFLFGTEAHSCVLQTGLSLLKLGKAVQVIADAVGSRRPIEKATALSRLSQRGAEITTTEITLLEWTESRSAPAFSQLLGAKHKTGSRYHVDHTGFAPDTEIGKDGDLRNAADIGRLLRQSRLDRKFTLKQVAEVAGCSLSQLSKIENNKAIPSLPLLKRLSAVLDRDVKSFLLES